jgi:hypothetical protein
MFDRPDINAKKLVSFHLAIPFSGLFSMPPSKNTTTEKYTLTT